MGSSVGATGPRGSAHPTIDERAGSGSANGTCFPDFRGRRRTLCQCQKVASYFGLAPRERSSGNRRLLGRITKEGDSLMRHLLVEAALIAAPPAGAVTRL